MSSEGPPDKLVKRPPDGGSGSGSHREPLDEKQIRRLVLIGVIVLIAVLALAFIFTNFDPVKVSFVFFEAEVRLIWVVLLSLVAGAFLGLAISRAAKKRMARRDS